MNRRGVLAAATALLPVGGCLTGASDPPGGAGGDTTTTREPADGNGNGNGSDPPNAPGDGSQFGAACPSFVDDADRTVCYRDRGDAAVYLEPSTRRFVEYETDEEPATITFTLHSEGGAPFRFNPHDWALKRRGDEGWEHVAPEQYPEPLVDVPPGGSYEWVLSTGTTQSPMAENATGVAVDLTSAETYAFRVHGTLGTERVECVARFRYLRAVPGV